MAEELGKIEKLPVDNYREGRKLCMVPLLLPVRQAEPELLEKVDRYWQQVEEQIDNLGNKLGHINRIYHELVAAGGEPGIKAIKELNEKIGKLAEKWLAAGAQLEAAEDAETLAEYLDWSRILSIGLESRKVLTRAYEAYQEAGKKRNEYVTSQIDRTLKANEIGVLIITEGHQVQFPVDIQVFYVSPPALDEIERWVRDQRTKVQDKAKEKPQEDKPEVKPETPA